jgi:hypothetical protein
MKSDRWLRYVAISTICAGPVGGFFLGLLNPGDPDPNPIGRVFYACMMTIETPLHAGFPPHHALGAGHFFNAWPHIIVAFLLILSWCIHRDGKSWRKRNQSAV